MAEILYHAVPTDWRREEKYRFLDGKEDIVRLHGQVITMSLKTVKVVKSEWQAILDRPLADICQIFETDNEDGRRLRQNSPFAGVLPPSEVWSIKAAIRQRYAKIAAASNA